MKINKTKPAKKNFTTKKKQVKRIRYRAPLKRKRSTNGGTDDPPFPGDKLNRING